MNVHKKYKEGKKDSSIWRQNIWTWSQNAVHHSEDYVTSVTVKQTHSTKNVFKDITEEKPFQLKGNAELRVE